MPPAPSGTDVNDPDDRPKALARSLPERMLKGRERVIRPEIRWHQQCASLSGRSAVGTLQGIPLPCRAAIRFRPRQRTRSACLWDDPGPPPPETQFQTGSGGPPATDRRLSSPNPFKAGQHSFGIIFGKLGTDHLDCFGQPVAHAFLVHLAHGGKTYGAQFPQGR